MVHDDSERKAVHLTVCVESASALRDFCVEQGVTLTALLDALGHVCGSIPSEVVAPWLALARRIDGQRRHRA